MLKLDGNPNAFRPVDTRRYLVCFSHLRWRFVFQRPQQLMTLATRHYKVLYVEEPLFEEGAEPTLRSERDESGVGVLTPILPATLTEAQAVAEQTRLTRELAADLGERIHVCWYYTPMAYEFSDGIEADILVYDCMDELSAFKGAPQRLAENERRLLRVADLLFTGGMSLYEAKRRLHRAVCAFPSSVDQHHFRKARRPSLPEPASQSHLRHPRIGYFGVIDERMDLNLVEAAARLRPNFEFILVGPVVKIEETSLPRRENLHWLGRQDYAVLPNFLRGWDVAFMPFALNASTRFISPTKTPEFLAAGIPVVSTAVKDVVRPYGERGLVKICDTPESLVCAVDALLSQPTERWLGEVDTFLAGMSWEKTWAEMHGLILQVTPDWDARRSPATSSTATAAARASDV
ncbi:glycosyltransferase (plasmid) [Ensifer adhaerens]|uniref:glycosyltransferase n=1 Tax=Ensifer adhaerens TaxID=106592 RepID=UPI001CBBCD38|nr:glycosyltransferase [Ensifer adhaerens]MBZ7927180.1 glycosyltransferase [Ensifer adhaerens]UAX98213.1 glycosyltransferase [Ensifer adhaerens]UAY05595.1 glycosyltransferase [Ensifer adhaerens]UAY12973.1 glycosyltransferase [Ensifer adhaerens]